MDVCCYGCTKIEYKGPVSPQNKFVDMNRTLYMPLEGAFEADAFYKYDYVAFLKVNGVSFIAQDLTDRAAEYASHLMESVFSTWPLFITAILMAFTAGCAIWILVRPSFSMGVFIMAILRKWSSLALVSNSPKRRKTLA